MYFRTRSKTGYIATNPYNCRVISVCVCEFINTFVDKQCRFGQYAANINCLPSISLYLTFLYYYLCLQCPVEDNDTLSVSSKTKEQFTGDNIAMDRTTEIIRHAVG